MKKKKILLGILAVSMAFLFPSSAGILHAEDFSSNEDYYQALCSQYNKDANVSATCNEFRSYLSSKSESLKSQVDSLNNDVAAIQSNIESLTEQINEQQKLIDKIQAMIDKNNEAIELISASIVKLADEIKQTEADIKKRDDQIKGRMVSEQASIGTNVYVEFVMGAKDIVELVSIADGIERITENDQAEIKALEADKAKLDQQKEEQVRLKEDQERAKRENEDNRAAAEKAKAYQEEMQAAYQRQEADLLEKIRSANAAISANQAKIIAVDSVYYQASDGWITPVAGARISAGAFYYPGGGFHGGKDFAASVGTPIVAPIGGVIVYANNPYGSYSGYLGNYVGHPSGAGNSVHMVGTVNGVTYGISFFHMAQENFVAYAGMGVSQGTVVGAVGHSGNSTGPHCHVEIINLGNISTDEAIARFQSSGADFAWGTGWSSEATSCGSRGYTPCRENPSAYI